MASSEIAASAVLAQRTARFIGDVSQSPEPCHCSTFNLLAISTHFNCTSRFLAKPFVFLVYYLTRDENVLIKF